jgi:hypothetical protein
MQRALSYLLFGKHLVFPDARVEGQSKSAALDCHYGYAT